MELYLEEGANIVNFIKKKYGKVNTYGLKEFFKNDFYSNRLKLTNNDIDQILYEIDRLLEYQGLPYTSLKYLGSGQSFGVIQVGNAVIKIGSKVECDYEDYRLPPIYERALKESKKMIYVSQMANGRKVTYDEMLEFYKELKEQGSLWLDPKVDNLGYVDEFLDFTKLYGATTDKGYKGPYLIDYEDVVTITPETKFDILQDYGSPDDRRELAKISDIYTIYYQLFIRKRSNLLEVEKQIALREGNFEKAHSCEIQQQKNFQNRTDYYDSHYHDGDSVNYPPSEKLINQDRRLKIVRAFKSVKNYFHKEKTPKK